MIKVESAPMSRLFQEVWKLIGREKVYPVEWKGGLLTPIYKKGDPREPKNYKPV